MSGQPLNFTIPESKGHASSLSLIPSPSVSGQPKYSQRPATSGHSSYFLDTKSSSLSFGALFNIHNLTPAYTPAPLISVSFPGANNGFISANPTNSGPALSAIPVLNPNILL